MGLNSDLTMIMGEQCCLRVGMSRGIGLLSVGAVLRGWKEFNSHNSLADSQGAVVIISTGYLFEKGQIYEHSPFANAELLNMTIYVVSNVAHPLHLFPRFWSLNRTSDGSSPSKCRSDGLSGRDPWRSCARNGSSAREQIETFRKKSRSLPFPPWRCTIPECFAQPRRPQTD